MSKIVSQENVVSVVLSGQPKGLPCVNTSALAIITHDEPVSPWGEEEFRIYLNAKAVEQDFGSISTTFDLAVSVFSQRANVLKGGGHLIVIPRKQNAPATSAWIESLKPVDFTRLTATDYLFKVWDDGSSVLDLPIGALNLESLETIEQSLNSQSGVEGNDLEFTVTGEITNAFVTVKTKETGVASSIGTAPLAATDTGSDLAEALNLLEKGSDGELRGDQVYGTKPGLELIRDALVRTASKIPYLGVIYTEKTSDSDLLGAAAYIQTLNRIQFVVSDIIEVLNDDSVFAKVTNRGLTHTRTLYYGASDLFKFAAGYASTLLSMNFDATSTSLTMNLKTIVGLDADGSIGDGELAKANKLGIDCYPSIGIPKVFSHEANLFADQIYTRLAYKVDLQIAAINFLAQTNTRIPQTEDGMLSFVSALTKVAQRFTDAGVFAPGEWTSPTVFGGNNGDILRENVRQWGFYLYSLPIYKQSTEARGNRMAPVILQAMKEAGAIHKADLVVEVLP